MVVVYSLVDSNQVNKMQCKNLILVVGVLVFLHGSDALFNTGGKHDSSKAVVKSCGSMSKSFDTISKSLDKTIASMETLSFTALDKKKVEMTAYKLAVQAYKNLFDSFAKSFGGTDSKPGPLELMASIKLQITTLGTVSGALATTLGAIDAVYKTTLGTTFPADTSAFAGILDLLFEALKTLIPFNKVTDAELATAIKDVDMAGLLKFFADYDVAATAMATQTKYIETQAKALEDYQKAVKSALAPFTKDLPKFTKTIKDNKDKGKTNFNGALDKEYSDQKKKGEKVQEALKKNADVDQTTAAAAASSKVDVFFTKFAAANVVANTGFSVQINSYYDYSVNLETTLTNSEVPILQANMESIATALFVNVNGDGQKCLKKMTPDLVKLFKAYVTSQYACFEDYTTYVAFMTEFVKIQISVVKCLGETAVNYLPACVKQISKKTSSTYATTLYAGCLTTFSGLLDTGFETGVGAIITAMLTQVTSDVTALQTTYTTCAADVNTVYGTDSAALLLTFTGCSPAPVVV